MSRQLSFAGMTRFPKNDQNFEASSRVCQSKPKPMRKAVGTARRFVISEHLKYYNENVARNYGVRML